MKREILLSLGVSLKIRKGSIWEKENLRSLFINGKNRALKTALKTYLTMMYLYFKNVFLHFIIQTDPSDGAYNMAPEQNRV